MVNPKALRQVDVVEYWKCSAAYVSQCVKKGMPLTTLEDADKWRAEKQPTGAGYRTKGEKVKAPQMATPPRAPATAQATQTLGTMSTSPEGDNEEGMLARVRATERGIFALLNSAIAAGEFKVIAIYQRDHSTAVRAVADAERTAMELRQERGELVERVFAKTVIHDALAPVMLALDNLPRNYGIKVRPDNAAEGERILQEAVDEIRRSAEAALRAQVKSPKSSRP